MIPIGANMKRLLMPILIMPLLVLLAGCGAGDRAPLPLRDYSARQQLDVPASGIINLEAGDTIHTVANRYGVTPRRIILANQLSPPYDLGGFNRINLPKPRTHRVRAGDSLDSISRQYNVTKASIISLNVLEPPYELRQGMEIAIPRRLDYSLLEASIDVESTQSAPITKKRTRPKQSLQTVRFSGSGADFAWPVNGDIIDRFGVSAKGVYNDGVNIRAASGTPVMASLDGEVAFVGSGLKSFGNLVLIKHKNGWITAYAHLAEVDVTEGQRVDRGTVIGAVGVSGRVDSPQLHFELRRARTPVDPEEYLS